MSRRDDRDEVLALALPDPELDLALDPADVVLTPHAVVRYRQRVEAVPHRMAVRRIECLITTARWRSRPRPRTEVVLHPGVIYGYSPRRPDVCLLVRDGVLVTVYSRRVLAQASRRATGRCR